MKPYIIEEEDEDYNEYFYALYTGEDLSTKYPDSYHFYLYIEKANLWERHAYRKDVHYREPYKEEKRDFVRYIFEAKEFTISS